MDYTRQTPTILSLCTGYGGIEMGIERVIGPVKPLAHVEIEAYAVANLVAKMETGAMVPAPVWTDLKTFPTHCFSGCVDILTGGYPCQPFSAAGKRKGKDDPRHLWPWIKEIIREVKPSICFFENVEGHISLGLREVLTDLVKLGYRVESDSGEPTWGLFSAAECGAPHQRKRVFILAYRVGSWLRGGRSGEKDRAKLKWILGGAGKRNSVWGQAQGCGFTEFGNAQSNNQRRPSITTMHREGITVGGSGGNQLADPGQQGLQRTGYTRQERRGQSSSFYPDRRADTWPARPREPQYPWEPPRVVADANKPESCKKRKPSNGWQQTTEGKAGKADRLWEKSKTKPGLGGNSNGATHRLDPNRNRIDRLRLLGNGVVPATAAKAFSTLMSRILNPKDNIRQVEVQMELF